MTLSKSHYCLLFGFIVLLFQLIHDWFTNFGDWGFITTLVFSASSIAVGILAFKVLSENANDYKSALGLAMVVAAIITHV